MREKPRWGEWRTKRKKEGEREKESESFTHWFNSKKRSQQRKPGTPFGFPIWRKRTHVLKSHSDAF